MPSNYPSGYDSFNTHHDNAGERVTAGDVNAIQDAVVAVQHGVGLNPTNTYVRRSAGTSSPVAALPFVNVSDFGAKGDGTTDDTAAIQAAANALTAGSELIFPPGKYILSSSVTISVPCLVTGAARGVNASGTDYGVVLINTTSGAGIFTCSASSIHFRRLYFTSYGGVAAAISSQATAITFTAGNYCSVAECAFSGWYQWIWFQNCAIWTVRDSHFANAAKYGVRVQNAANPDTGDSVLTGNNFVTGNSWTPDAFVRQESSGGLRVTDNKFLNPTIGAAIFIDVAVADGASTSILVVEGNSFEKATLNLIRITQAGPSNTGVFGKVIIVGNQLSCGSATGAAVDISSNRGVAGDISKVLIADNEFDGDGATKPASFIRIGTATRVTIDGNQFNDGPVGVEVTQQATNVVVTPSNAYHTVTTPVSGVPASVSTLIPPSGSLRADAPVPVVTATPSTTGGSLAAGTYYYRVAYADSTGAVGLPCNEVSAIVGGAGAGSVALAWAAWPVTGTPRGRIYRGVTSGSLTEVQSLTAASVTDTGAGWSAGSPPAASNLYAAQLSGSLLSNSQWVIGNFFGVNKRTAVSALDLGGSLGLRRDIVANANFTAGVTNCIIAYTSLTAARVVTLPTTAGIDSRIYIVKDESGSCSGSNTITVQGTSGQTIDGAASVALSAAYGVLRVYSSGANWFTF